MLQPRTAPARLRQVIGDHGYGAGFVELKPHWRRACVKATALERLRALIRRRRPVEETQDFETPLKMLTGYTLRVLLAAQVAARRFGATASTGMELLEELTLLLVCQLVVLPRAVVGRGLLQEVALRQQETLLPIRVFCCH